MTETVVTWAALVASVLCLISILTFWGRYSDRLTKAESAASAAVLANAALTIKLDSVQQELSAYKETAALMFVSEKELFHAEQRFTGLVDEIKQDIRGVTERLDRVLEARGIAPLRG